MSILLSNRAAFAQATAEIPRKENSRKQQKIDANWELIARLVGPTGNDVAFSHDGTKLLTAGKSKVRIWDARELKPVTALLDHRSEITVALLSPDGKLAVTAGARQVQIWNAVSGEQIRLLAPKAEVTCAAFSPDGKSLALGTKDGWVRLWNPLTGKSTLGFPNGDQVRFIAFSPNGARLLALSMRMLDKDDDNGTIGVWDAATGREISSKLIEDSANIEPRKRRSPAAFSPDGKFIASIMFKAVEIWNAGTGAVTSDWQTWDRFGSGPTLSVHFSPDGGELVTANEGTLQIWNPNQTIVPHIWLDHPGEWFWVYDAVFSPDAKNVLLSCSGTGSGVWNLHSEKQLFAVSSPDTTAIPAVAFDPGGNQVAIGYSAANVTTIWRRSSDVGEPKVQHPVIGSDITP